MANWYVAPSLAVLRAEINARWPGRDRASDGSIGDAAHQASRSDHNPNGRDSVNAIDIDKDGIDVAAVIAAVQRHPSTHYWIYNRQIADRDDGWRRRPYTGSNPHDKHLHVSIRQTRTAEQDRRPWGLLEDDMPLTNADKMGIWTWDLRNGAGTDPAYVVLNRAASEATAAKTEATKARLTAEATLAAVKGLDTKAVLARINEVAHAEQQRDAELADLVARYQSGQVDAVAVVDELVARLTGTPQG
ncbi:hypothetical protein ABZ814_13550 [Micromonospora musae]|uniref:hypothetical protein n=1 Tax=Micromonospora musae TaxID=1894970 RepID=UPI0033C6F1E8